MHAQPSMKDVLDQATLIKSLAKSFQRFAWNGHQYFSENAPVPLNWTWTPQRQKESAQRPRVHTLYVSAIKPIMYFHFWRALWWPAYRWRYPFSKDLKQELYPEIAVLHSFSTAETEGQIPLPNATHFSMDRFLEDAWLLSPQELVACLDSMARIYDEVEREMILRKMMKVSLE